MSDGKEGRGKVPRAEAARLLHAWLTESLRSGDVPRIADALRHSREMGWGLGRASVARVVRAHGAYAESVPQQRRRSGGRFRRSVVVRDLGHWHADIGFFSVNRRYETPRKYRAGFLVAKDVLSRYVYAVPLEFDRRAPSMIRAFGALFDAHAAERPEEGPVRSVAFDRETSVASKAVQAYLASRGVAFHSFRLSRSKAKFAEGAIRQIREATAKLLERNLAKDRWWTLLPTAVASLNARPIVVGGRRVGGFAPRDVAPSNLRRFLAALERASPGQYLAQYDIAPGLVDFRYRVGDAVRVKKIVTSSAVLGEKRSERALADGVFEVERRLPFVTADLRVGKAYVVRGADDGGASGPETFEEDDLVPATGDRPFGALAPGRIEDPEVTRPRATRYKGAAAPAGGRQ